jgi:hypothetical protein
MSIFEALTMGESQRLDYVIREHEKLQRQVEALTTLLVERGVISRESLEDAASAASDAPPPDAG